MVRSYYITNLASIYINWMAILSSIGSELDYDLLMALRIGLLSNISLGYKEAKGYEFPTK